MHKAMLIGLVAALATLAYGQDVSREVTKLMAKRAAEADAYRNLAETVYGLQINSRTYVQDFVAESDDIRTDVDTFVKGVRLGTPTFYEDGSCEVPAEVTVAQVIQVLKEAHRRHYDGDRVKADDFEHMQQQIQKTIIKTVGMGAPRADLPPDLPIGAEEQLPPLPPNAPAAPVPAIWQQAGPQARMLAFRAAELDAKRQLAERIKGLRLTSRTQVRDFMAESDVINTELQTSLVGAEVVGRYLHSDELIAEVTVRLPTEQVITTIRRLSDKTYHGDHVEGYDIEDVVKKVVKRDFEATGMGVPRPDVIRRYMAKTETYYPDWTLEPLSATGEATAEDMSTAQGRLMAARAAEIVAKRNLAEQIAGLRIQGNTTVRDFMTEADMIDASVNAVIVNAVVTETKFSSDSAVVTVQVPGMQVWETLRLRRATSH